MSLAGRANSLRVPSLPRPRGLADMDPVGSTIIAGVAVARRFAEGFQQDRPEAVAVVPVIGNWRSMRASRREARQGRRIQGKTAMQTPHWG